MPEYIVFQRWSGPVDPANPHPVQAQAAIVTADDENAALRAVLDSRMLPPSVMNDNPYEIADIEANAEAYEIEITHDVKGKLEGWTPPIVEIPDLPKPVLPHLPEIPKA